MSSISTRRSLLTSPGQRNWYATIIGRTDLLASEYANLYYAWWPSTSNWQRQFLGVPIRFRLQDNDSDGLPDAWENHHWPGVPIAFIAPDADEDGDGHSHLDEYLTDTDPRDSASCLRIMDFHSSISNGTVLTWQSSEYKYYTIESSANLGTNGTVWTGISSRSWGFRLIFSILSSISA